VKLGIEGHGSIYPKIGKPSIEAAIIDAATKDGAIVEAAVSNKPTKPAVPRPTLDPNKPKPQDRGRFHEAPPKFNGRPSPSCWAAPPTRRAAMQGKRGAPSVAWDVWQADRAAAQAERMRRGNDPGR